MPSVELDQKALDQTIRDAIATTIAASLTPDAFTTFVSGVLSMNDRFSQKSLIENACIESIKKHLSPIIDEWVEQNKDELRRQVFARMETEMGPALGDRVVDHIKSQFRIERTGNR